MPSHPSTGKLIPRKLRNPCKMSVSSGPLITILNKCAFFNFYIMSDGRQDDITTSPARDSPALTTALPQQLIQTAGQRTMPCSTTSREPGTPSTQTQLSQWLTAWLWATENVFSTPVFSNSSFDEALGLCWIRVYSIKQICRQAFCKHTEIGLNLKTPKWHMTHCLHPAREGAIN